MSKFRVKVAFKEWVRMTYGYEYPTKGVKFLYITLDAPNAPAAREEVKRRLSLMDIDGHAEDVTEVITEVVTDVSGNDADPSGVGATPYLRGRSSASCAEAVAGVAQEGSSEDAGRGNADLP
jgi:hypothetical protein